MRKVKTTVNRLHLTSCFKFPLYKLLWLTSKTEHITQSVSWVSWCKTFSTSQSHLKICRLTNFSVSRALKLLISCCSRRSFRELFSKSRSPRIFRSANVQCKSTKLKTTTSQLDNRRPKKSQIWTLIMGSLLSGSFLMWSDRRTSATNYSC